MAPDTPPGPVSRGREVRDGREDVSWRWLTYTSYSLYFDGAEMTNDETEFLLAVAAYQKRFRRRYPTWLEVLNILRCLGYRKSAEPVPICEPQPPNAETSEFEIMKAKFEQAKTEPP